MPKKSKRVYHALVRGKGLFDGCHNINQMLISLFDLGSKLLLWQQNGATLDTNRSNPTDDYLFFVFKGTEAEANKLFGDYLVFYEDEDE